MKRAAAGVRGPQETQQEKLEDAARVINRGFMICISDRAMMDDSRKWGTYYMTNLLFRVYFKVRADAVRVWEGREANGAGGIAERDWVDEEYPEGHQCCVRGYAGTGTVSEEPAGHVLVLPWGRPLSGCEVRGCKASLDPMDESLLIHPNHQAEENLMRAYNSCHAAAKRQQEYPLPSRVQGNLLTSPT